MSAELVEWALALMLATSPPGRSHIRAAIETPEVGRARYAEIAAAIVSASDGNKRAVSLLLAVSHHESGWRRDVDFGIGPLARGDHGQSCGLFQFRVGPGKRCDELTADRRLAASEALRLARRSFAACRTRPVLEQLAAYTSGDCAKGAKSSIIRMMTAERFLSWQPVQVVIK
jgi:hypothetical protein